MSRAFAGLGFAAGVVFILIIIAGAIKGGARGVVNFIENYYVILGIILFLIIAAICAVIFGAIESSISKANKIVNCIGAGLAMSQNAVFLVYGLHHALTIYLNDAFLIFLALGGFIVVYIINCFITFFGVVLSVGKSWGSIIQIIIVLAGIWLISAW